MYNSLTIESCTRCQEKKIHFQTDEKLKMLLFIVASNRTTTKMSSKGDAQKIHLNALFLATFLLANVVEVKRLVLHTPTYHYIC